MESWNHGKWILAFWVILSFSFYFRDGQTRPVILGESDVNILGLGKCSNVLLLSIHAQLALFSISPFFLFKK